MKTHDISKLIEPTKLRNTNEKGIYGNEKYDTVDKFFLFSQEELDEYLPRSQFELERMASPTDYSLATGAGNNYDWQWKNGSCHQSWMLRSNHANGTVQYVNKDGDVKSHEAPNSCKRSGLRLAVRMNIDGMVSLINSGMSDKYFKIMSDEEKKHYFYTWTYNRDNIGCIRFGEFASRVADDSDDLEKKFLRHNPEIKPTGKKIAGYQDTYGKCEVNYQYEYRGQRYVRLKTHYEYSTNLTYDNGKVPAIHDDYVWMKVEPIIWNILNWNEMPKEINPRGTGDAESVILLARRGLVSGINFYPNCEDSHSKLWQNSSPRGFANGINVNNIKGNGNTKCGAPCGGDFTNMGLLSFAFENIQENYLEGYGEPTKKPATKTPVTSEAKTMGD